jgi:hypothetical protein
LDNRRRENRDQQGGSKIPAKKPNLQKPSKVERARARLDSAVARLETAINRRADAAAGDDALSQPSLKELEGLRVENSQLKDLGETVSGRLDAAIGRLRSVIGE